MSNKKILKGIFSSADIRKAILNHKITNEINNIYNKRLIIFKDQFEKDKDILNIKLTVNLLIDRKTKKIIDIIEYEKTKLLTLKKNKKKLNVWCVAGGKGKRLMPYLLYCLNPLA